MASQATQIYYIVDPKDKNWSVVRQGKRASVELDDGMADKQKKKKVRGAGKYEKLYKRMREGHPPIELEWQRGEPERGPPEGHNTRWGSGYIYVIPPGGVRHVMTVAGSRFCAFRTYLQGSYLTGGGDHYGTYRRRILIRTIWTEVDMPCFSVSWLLLRPPLLPISLVRLLRQVLSSADRIDQLKKEVAAGTFVPDGHNDVLTRALGSAEHSGRTRGVGSYSGLRKVFKGNMKPRKPGGNYMTEEDLLQRLPSLLQQYGVFVSGGALDFASMSQHTPAVAPHYGQRSSKASTDFVDFADLTDVAVCYLRISYPADYIVAHGSSWFIISLGEAGAF
ncbi:unnamed protein product [Cuscuta campestris]|uniref:Uncharacterized protein n=1 Tax=Cuscuta campestris TaxID=132261 RepID=A0A484ML78_9ASTE|nr:unnamed protein product [Cuscuta campestris]